MKNILISLIVIGVLWCRVGYSQAEEIAVAAQFNPVKFDACGYARLAKAAGMKYIIITSKHHDGFAMFDSRYTDFDIMDARRQIGSGQSGDRH